MKIYSVVGARPNIIKMAPIHKKLSGLHDHKIIHTGQHYDYKMSEVFFKEFALPHPTYNLCVGSGTANYQIGEMILRLDKVFLKSRPDLVLVYGDTNSTLAGALSAQKSDIRVGHIEAGLRSFDRRMPEETNRVIVDHVSDYLFVPTRTAFMNLRKEAVRGAVFNTGDISVEIVNVAEKLKSTVLSDFKIEQMAYILLTMHRAENTNSVNILRSIVKAIRILDAYVSIVFPIHPRTRKALMRVGLYKSLEKCKRLKLISPVGYKDFIHLIDRSVSVVTDSGGVQKEAYLLGTPCLTLRTNTEWVETVEAGWNELVGTAAQSIVRAIKNQRIPQRTRKPLFGRGKTSDRILKILDRVIA